MAWLLSPAIRSIAALAGYWTLVSSALAAPVALDHEPEAWTGDFDGMLERRIVRVLVPYSRTLYFNDKGAQRGIVADALKDFETFLNRKYKLKNRPITVVALPATRDYLIPGVAQGTGDIAAGNITITKEREKRVDFSSPFYKDVAEIVVTGPASPELATTDDLAGREVHVRRSSSYYESLVRLNQRFRALDKPQMTLTLMPEALEDEDLMEMVAVGMLALIVVDDWKAKLWAGLLPKIVARTDLAVAGGGSVGWAFRKDSPQLAAVLNEFVRRHPSMYAARFKAYPAYLRKMRNATAEADWQRFEKTIALFRKYGSRYDFDPLMVAALGYQESRLDQNARSHVGAIGIMQLMPETGRSLKVGDITKAEPNVHGGFKYLRQIYDRHLDTAGLDEQNRTLFAIASYNAGSGRIARLRTEAADKGLDPNLWFNNVELVAERRIGHETVVYVRNIYKYYIAYKMQLDTLEARRAAVKPETKKP